MEDTLTGLLILSMLKMTVCLNPCSNGRYSHRKQNLRILEFRGFDNCKTYKIGFVNRN